MFDIVPRNKRDRVDAFGGLFCSVIVLVGLIYCLAR